MGDLIGGQSTTRHFDHCTDLVVQFDLFLLLHQGCYLMDDRHLEVELPLIAHKRNHHFRLHLDALFLNVGGSLKDGAGLCSGDFRVCNPKTTSAVAQHRVGFVQRSDAFGYLCRSQLQLCREVGLGGLIVRNELMKRGIQEADRGREALERLEDSSEISALVGQDLGERLLSACLGVSENHLTDCINTIAFEEHVFCACQPDASGSKSDCVCSLLGSVGVGANRQARGLRTPLHELLEVLELLCLLSFFIVADGAGDDLAGGGLQFAAVHNAARAIDGKEVAFLENLTGNGHRFLFVVNQHVGGSANADLAHLTRHESRVRGHAALGGQNPFGGDHPSEIFRRGFVAHQQHLFVLFIGGRCSAIRVEIDLARGGAWAGWEAFCKGLGLLDVRKIEDRSKKLVELVGRIAEHRSFPVDKLFLVHVHGELKRRGCGALSVTRLEHEQLAFLNGELHVLHVLEMFFQNRPDLHQFGERLGHFLLQTSHRLWCANPCHDVFALGVDQEFSIEFIHPVRRVTRESHSGTGCCTRVSVHHCLHVDCSTPCSRDVVFTTVHDGTVVHPGSENGTNSSLELVVNVSWKTFPGAIFDEFFEALDEFLVVFRGQFAVQKFSMIMLMLVLFDDDFKRFVIFTFALLHPQNHVAVHLHKAAVAIPGKALVIGRLCKREHRLVVETEVQNRVHHAGH